jgi:hypothetical protein
MTPSSSSDDQLGLLMRLAQRGDATAYRELLHAITPRIRRVVARQRGFSRPEDIEDVVQEVSALPSRGARDIGSSTAVHAVDAGNRAEPAR